NLAFENTFNERGFHGCETVSVVGFHAATVNPGCVRLIAAIRTQEYKKDAKVIRIRGILAYWFLVPSLYSWILGTLVLTNQTPPRWSG
ncbi:MAG: hypothetical protein PHW10_05330, partial [Candidatus Peribacteraceae bacterium]|nr:hypothetical protein [Candidatus Peribacteraceae bacterium]